MKTADEDVEQVRTRAAKTAKNLGFYKKFLVFGVFKGFFWYEDQTQKYDSKARENTPYKYILLKTNLEKNEYEIDEFHKSQLQFEYNVYLLNYTIKIYF